MIDRNCLTWWHPRLVAAGLPTPRTEVVDAGEDWRDLALFLDGRAPTMRAKELSKRLILGIWAAAERLGGYPIFLRTGQGSGKHNWESCCHVPDAESVGKRIGGLVEWSECVSFFGLPYRYWCVREMLPVRAVTTLGRYGGMPLAMEVRCFIAGGKVLCFHPYWPVGAICEGLDRPSATVARGLHYLADPLPHRAEWMPLAERVAEVFAKDESWSVDILRTERGWTIIDMAEASESYHEEGCPNARGAA